MDFDTAKENIQPLARGRDVKRLEIALNAEQNDSDALQELNRQKRDYENAIKSYDGDDPLDLWYEYISWIEQCYPKSGKDSAIDQLLEKCLKVFAAESQYFQDRRLIKLYIKFIDSQPNPVDYLQQMYSAGIGTMVADFYICWAHYYDLADNFKKANEIYQKGFDAQAQPAEELKHAHTQFTMSIGQRMLTNEEDDKSQFRSMMEEKRNALTSLKSFKKKYVGSIRTGAAIRSMNPGRIPSTSSIPGGSAGAIKNEKFGVYEEEQISAIMNPVTDAPVGETSVIQSIIDNVRHQENRKEPGPWSRPKELRSHAVISDARASALGFEICEDMDESIKSPRTKKSKPVVISQGTSLTLPPNFITRNFPQPLCNYPLYIEEKTKPLVFPCYEKMFVYPGGSDEEFSPEELRMWRLAKTSGLTDNRIKRYDQMWDNTLTGIRLYPGFVKYNEPQPEFIVTSTDYTEYKDNPNYKLVHSFPLDDANDYTVEDLLAEQWRSNAGATNKTLCMDVSVDETMIGGFVKRRTTMFKKNEMMDATNVFIEKDDGSTATTPIATAVNGLEEKNCISMPPKTEITTDFEIFTDDEIEKMPEKKSGTEISLEPKILVEPAKPIIEFEFKLPSALSVPSKTSDITQQPSAPMSTGAIKKKTPSKSMLPLPNRSPSNLLTKSPMVAPPTAVEEDNRPKLFGQAPPEGDDDITCSTQAFNLFIKMKSHGASTPLTKSRESMLPRTHLQKVPMNFDNDDDIDTGNIASTAVIQENENEPSPLKEEASEKMPDITIFSPPLDPVMTKVKQLSTIMETSETNTASSSANTRSSVEEQLGHDSLASPAVPSKSLKVIQTKENQLSIIEEISTSDAFPVRKELSTACNSLILPNIENARMTTQRNSTEKAIDDLCNSMIRSPIGKFKIPAKPNDSVRRAFINDSVTMPSLRDILVPVAQALSPTTANQSALPDFSIFNGTKPTEINLSCFGAGGVTGTSKNLSFAVPTDESKLIKFSYSRMAGNKTNSNLSHCIENHGDEIVVAVKQEHIEEEFIDSANDEDDDCVIVSLGKSIYVPDAVEARDVDEEWDDVQQDPDNTFMHKNIDLNQTKQNIDHFLGNPANKINPYDVDLCDAFLQEIDFYSVIESRSDCELVNQVKQLNRIDELTINNEKYTNIVYLCRGAFGKIFKGVNKDGKAFAFKQERPPNFWEYYITLVIRERILEDFLPAFLAYDQALIGNNSSIFVTEFIEHGTLIDICNKHHVATSKHLDELIVMLFAIEIFKIIDHLHGSNIIHSDIKPDNFMLMAKPTFEALANGPFLKLIDFGNAIDMTRFPAGTTFQMLGLKTENFVCTEMLEQRPWTYQQDFYCMAGTLHVLLFGRYMKSERKMNEVQIGTSIPRYFNKPVWNNIFTKLLNIPDCKTFPNLQQFKSSLKEAIVNKHDKFEEKLKEFCRILNMK